MTGSDGPESIGTIPARTQHDPRRRSADQARSTLLAAGHGYGGRLPVAVDDGDRNKRHDPPSWQQVVAAAGSAVGGAAWVSAVGSAIVGLRLEKAGLPVESTVALMSAEHRFVIGIGFLVVPLFVGLLAFICEWVVLAGWPHSIGPGGRLLLAAGAIVVAAALGLVIFEPSPWWLFITQCAVVLVAVPAAFVILGHVHDRRRGRRGGSWIRGRPPEYWHRLDEIIVLFLAVLISAGVIALIVVGTRDATFDTAEVDLREGQIQGKYVTTTPNAVVLIMKRDHECWGIGAVPRDQIVRILIGPDTDKVEMPDSCTE
jgi:hypothetical protein